jgi:penicillin amidase
MKTSIKLLFGLLALLLLFALASLAWTLHKKQPLRDGAIDLARLQAPVTVQYDARGVPHIDARTEADLYRALGFVHAQDRLFQMEAMRRLANGELAEVFGADLLPTDRLMRTLGLRHHAQRMAAAMDPRSPETTALMAYLDGVNQYQATQALPLEFNLLHIAPRAFTPQDTLAVAAYWAYSASSAFQTEPVMTFIRDQLGVRYLDAFSTDWGSQGVAAPPRVAASAAQAHPGVALTESDWHSLNQWARVSREASTVWGAPRFQSSNAWAVSGRRTASGKPLLAGDPHMGFSVPTALYEAHLNAPGFALYGHFQALMPFALLGHNQEFGWTLGMLHNDEMDLVAEKPNPNNPNQVWHQDQWVDLKIRSETIAVKDAPSVHLRLRTAPHGPVISDAFQDAAGRTPIALWWNLYQSDTPPFGAWYALHRAHTLERARDAASQIQAPGMNLVWANAEGDIARWAVGRITQRPAGVNPMFVLDAGRGEADKAGDYHFGFNPYEENPPRGYVLAANNQPQSGSGVPVPGYYLLDDRFALLDQLLADPATVWSLEAGKKLQLEVCSGYPDRLLRAGLPLLEAVVTDGNEQAFLEPLQKWDGCYTSSGIAPTLFRQFSYELAAAAFADELGPAQFANLLASPALDHALPALLAQSQSAWWDDVRTPQQESRFETVRIAWSRTFTHLQTLYGTHLTEWTWRNNHHLTHRHPLGREAPLTWLLNVGPFAVPGGRETPSNMSGPLGPGPWTASAGPAARMVLDFGNPGKGETIGPLGQSGVPLNRHHADQSDRYLAGRYAPMWLLAQDIAKHARSTLTLQPPL